MADYKAGVLIQMLVLSRRLSQRRSGMQLWGLDWRWMVVEMEDVLNNESRGRA